MQAVEGRQWWIANLGSSEIQSHPASLTSEHDIHLATTAGYKGVDLSVDYSVYYGADYSADSSGSRQPPLPPPPKVESPDYILRPKLHLFTLK